MIDLSYFLAQLNFHVTLWSQLRQKFGLNEDLPRPRMCTLWENVRCTRTVKMQLHFVELQARMSGVIFLKLWTSSLHWSLPPLRRMVPEIQLSGLANLVYDIW